MKDCVAAGALVSKIYYLCMVMKRIAILSILLLFASCIKEKNDFIELKVGDRLPKFAVVMNDGSIVSDQSLSGTVSVVVFFHTGCPDCQRTLPSVQKVYDEHSGDAVQFALISRAQTEKEIAPYWKENGYTMPYSAQADRKIYELFAKERIPRVYICDDSGVIRYIFTDNPTPSYEDLSLSLSEVLSEL